VDSHAVTIPERTSEGGLATRRPATFWAGLSLILAFLGCGVFVLDPYGERVLLFGEPVLGPGEPFLWFLGGVLGVASLMIVFWSYARYSLRWPTRMLFAVALVLALYALVYATACSYLTFASFPRMLAPALLVVAVGAWLGHHRWLSITLVLLIAFTIVGALQPPSAKALPIRLRSGDLAASLTSMRRWGDQLSCTFLVKAATPGTSLERDYDLRDATVEGSAIHGLLPMVPWFSSMKSSRMRRGLLIGPWDPLIPDAFNAPPRWIRSMDLTLGINRWPSRPLVSASFAAPRSGEHSPPVSARRNGVELRLYAIYGEARAGMSREPQSGSGFFGHGISFSLTCDGYRDAKAHRWRFPWALLFPPPPSQWQERGLTLRVSDQMDRILDIEPRILPVPDGATEITSDASSFVWVVPDDVKTVKVDLFTPEQIERGRMLFHFRGLPNPSARRP
jgi:hypothetical protein